MPFESLIALIIHVISGMLATVLLYAVWLELLKNKTGKRWLRFSSLSAAILMLISWISGGRYYTSYYGSVVKAKILAGSFPWAHTVMTETKEHIFLFLPVVTIALCISCWLLSDEVMAERPLLKKKLAVVAGIATVLGILMALMGVLISGGIPGAGR